MKQNIKDIFEETLGMTKNDEIDKSEIIKIGEKCNVEFSPRSSKVNIVSKIIEEGYYDKLYEAFSELLYIPVWTVADYFGINSEDVLQLEKLGIITEIPVAKEFYSRRNKEYYTANTYNISILEHYKKEDLKELLNKANSGKGYNIRIETDTKEEIQTLVDELEKVFRVGDRRVYSRRNVGYNTYFNVKILNNTELEKNALLEEIKETERKSREEISRLRKEYEKRIEELFFRIHSREKTIIQLSKELDEYRK